MTATTVVMPKMGYDMTQGKIVRWLKHEGDRVEKGDAIAEIETDKVNIQIESFASGNLQKIIVHEGESVPVGQPIAQIGEPGDEPPVAQPNEQRQRQQTGAGEGAEAPALEVTGVAPEIPAEPKTPPSAGEEERAKASPIARRLAEEHGIELGSVSGSGPGGRITKEDVEKYLAEAASQPTPAAPAVAPTAAGETPALPGAQQPTPAAPAVAPPEGVPVETQELSRMGQAIARHMALSKSTIPHFYTTVEIDMSMVATLREELNQTLSSEERFSYNDFIMKATAVALTQFPKLNSFYTEGKRNIFKQVNIGMAIALEDGLIAPVIRECDQKSLFKIAQESRDLAARTRQGTLRQADYSGGTFTVTNMGMLGVEEFSAIINPPQAAILAVGTVAPRPAVHENSLVVAKTMKATLSADHRVVNGADAARFLGELKVLLENSARLLL